MQVYVSDDVWNSFVDATGIHDADFVFDLALRVILAAKDFNVERHIEQALTNQSLELKVAFGEYMNDVKSTYDVVNQEIKSLMSTTNTESPIYNIITEINSLKQKPVRTPIEMGQDFEKIVGDTIYSLLNNGEYIEATGLTNGNKKDDKKGDYIIVCPSGSKFSIEVKRDKNYSWKKIVDEINAVNENRGTNTCIFVLYSEYGLKLQPITIINDKDILVLYKNDEVEYEHYLNSAIILARSFIKIKEKEYNLNTNLIKLAIENVIASTNNLNIIEAKSSDIIKISNQIKEQVSNGIVSLQKSVNLLNVLLSDKDEIGNI